VVGLTVSVLGGAMLLPAAVEWGTGGPDALAFLGSALAVGTVGVILTLAFRSEGTRLTVRQMFVLTNASWIASTLAAALPFTVTSVGLGATDAVFEAMSGLTTTGSTVIVGLDHLPQGILLWRGLTQGIGGIGIIVMAMAVLPKLHVAGLQLFQSESSERSEKVLPHWAQIMRAIVLVYVAICGLGAIVFGALGMSLLDAVVHAMASVSTGGFANYDSSFGYYQNPAIEWAGALFMALGALPFVFYIQLVTRQHRQALANPQVGAFFLFLLVTIAILVTWLVLNDRLEPMEAVRHATFNVVSVVTTTGLVTVDYTQWGPFAVVLFFFLTFVGGCTGSTAGGLKIFHFQILMAVARVQIRRLFHPHGVFVARYGGKPVPESVFASVLSFLLLYVLSFTGFSLGLALTGLDLTTALSGAATALANVGPGLGSTIGPAGNFASLPDSSKWILTLAMLMGRLELFTVLVLFAPSFWRD
jgi:trk system potassium uptake protein TrkH